MQKCRTAGVLTTLILVGKPAISWAPLGLIAIGISAAASGVLLLSGIAGSRIQKPQAVAEIFMVVYVACCFGGGLSGHAYPLTPLLSVHEPFDAGGKHWMSANSEDQAQAFIGAAVAATQRTLRL